jgi:hypothetical protein
MNVHKDKYLQRILVGGGAWGGYFGLSASERGRTYKGIPAGGRTTFNKGLFLPYNS